MVGYKNSGIRRKQIVLNKSKGKWDYEKMKIRFNEAKSKLDTASSRSKISSRSLRRMKKSSATSLR